MTTEYVRPTEEEIKAALLRQYMEREEEKRKRQPKEASFIVFVDTPVRLVWIKRGGDIVTEQVITFSNPDENEDED